MKILLILIFALFTIGCQRDKISDLGVGYNKTLILPPNNILPKPGSNDPDSSKDMSSSENNIVISIIDRTEENIIDENIIEKIDNVSGYKTDENFFQWLFKGKSKR